MRKRGLCCRPVCVCLSLCLSITLVDGIEMAKDIVKFISRPGSPIILVFFVPERRYPIPMAATSTRVLASTRLQNGVE